MVVFCLESVYSYNNPYTDLNCRSSIRNQSVRRSSTALLQLPFCGPTSQR